MVTNCSNCGEALAVGARFCPSCGTRVAEGDEPAGLIGRIFNQKYRLEEEIGEGSMGKVFLGEHLGLKKRVALKVLHSDLTLGGEVLQRFQLEGIAAGKFTHPNAIQIFDFDCSEDGHSYLAMEYVEGRNLRQYLTDEGLMAPPLAVDVSLQVLAAVAEAHKHGIVHRDLKPENIMVLLSADGALNVKVLDFGLSKLVDRPQGSSMMTQPGRILGTPLYMAPEQAGGEEVDHRSDLYAVGLILYELLAGEGPFQGESFTELLVKQATTPPPSLIDTHPELGLSEQLEDVIDKALEKERTARFQTASEMIDALQRAELDGKGRTPGSRPRRQPAKEPVPTARRVPVLGVVAAVAVLALGAFGVSFFIGGSTAEAGGFERVRLKPAAARTEDESHYLRLLDEARSSLRNGSTDVALSAIQDAYDLDCRDAEVYVVRALAYRARNDEDTAAADLAAALEEDPSYGEAAALLGWLEHDRGRTAEAAAAFQRALDTDPKLPTALAGKATLLREEGDSTRAEELLLQAVAQDKGCAPAQYQLGLLRLEQGDALAASNALVEAKRSQPKNWRIYTALGDAYRMDGRDEDAEGQYHAAIELDSRASGALLGLAALLAEKERFAELIDVLEIPLGEAPDQPSLQRLLAVALQSRGDTAAAIRALKHAVSSDDEDAGTHTLLGVLYTVDGDLGLALEALDRALEIDANFASALRNRGLALFELQRYDEAATALASAVELDGEDAYAHLMLGVLYMEYVDDRIKSAAHLEAYQELGGDDPRVEAWLARVR